MKEYTIPGNLKEVVRFFQEYQPQLKQIKIEPTKPKKKGLSAGAITAIALGGSALVLTGAALGFWFARRRYIAENLCCDITSHGDEEICCDDDGEECTCDCCKCEEPAVEEPVCECECCKDAPAEEEACKCDCEEAPVEANPVEATETENA